MMAKRLAALLPFAALAVAILAAPLDLFAAAPVTRQVTLKAGQFAFDPPTLHVNRGDRVVIILQSSDVVHGLYVDGYGVSARVEPGRSERVEFVADKAGAFRYRFHDRRADRGAQRHLCPRRRPGAGHRAGDAVLPAALPSGGGTS
jgi:plastocyanin